MEGGGRGGRGGGRGRGRGGRGAAARSEEMEDEAEDGAKEEDEGEEEEDEEEEIDPDEVADAAARNIAAPDDAKFKGAASSTCPLCACTRQAPSSPSAQPRPRSASRCAPPTITTATGAFPARTMHCKLVAGADAPSSPGKTATG